MSSDCLVLNLKDESMNLYIIYDALRMKYCLWGKSKQIDIEDSDCESEVEHFPFYFSCEKKNKKHLYSFINFVLDKYIDITLFNFPDLPNGCSEITYDVLEDMDDVDNVIAYYAQQVYDNENKLNMENLLNILAFIRNDYHI
jgi:hypothetical protein